MALQLERTRVASSVCLLSRLLPRLRGRAWPLPLGPTTWRRGMRRRVRKPENPALRCTLASPPLSAAYRAAPFLDYDFTQT